MIADWQPNFILGRSGLFPPVMYIGVQYTNLFPFAPFKLFLFPFIGKLLMSYIDIAKKILFYLRIKHIQFLAFL